MKKVIKGKLYDTETARKLLSWDNGRYGNDFDAVSEGLFVKKTGEYFLWGCGGSNTKYGVWRGNSGGAGERIIPFKLDEAKNWVEKKGDGEDFERIFGRIEELEGEEVRQQLTVVLPMVLVEELREQRDKSGQTMTAQIIAALRAAGYGTEV
jgi:hypothetical protein